VEGQHIGFGGNDLFDGTGGDHAIGFQTHQLTGVSANLFS
jgi:hypothetical protein